MGVKWEAIFSPCNYTGCFLLMSTLECLKWHWWIEVGGQDIPCSIHCQGVVELLWLVKKVNIWIILVKLFWQLCVG